MSVSTERGEEKDAASDTEHDRDSLVPVTGSITGDVTEDGCNDVSEMGEEVTEEEDIEDDMPDIVQGTTKTLISKLEENLTAVPDQYDSTQLLATEPGPLDPEGKDIEQVLNIISHSIYRESEGQIVSKLCDRSALLSVVSHSLSAYITTLESVPLQRLSSRIASELSLWICDLFGFPEGQAHCHDDIREGLVRTVRMVLHTKYPDLSSEGFLALTKSSPVIYITSGTYAEVASYVCNHLNLPASTIRCIISEEEKPRDDSWNFFSSVIEEDLAAGRMPLMCVANVHSTIFQTHSVAKLKHLCTEKGLWLHLEGHALSGLTLVSPGAHIRGDSMTLTIGNWIGVPAVPFVTLYSIPDTAGAGPAQIAGLSLVNPSVRLGCLPLWCVMRSLGQDEVRARVRAVFRMLETISDKLAAMPCLRLLSQASERKEIRISDLETGSVDKDFVFNTVSPALAFQYVSESPSSLEGRVPAYTDNLNSWLGQILQRDAPHVPVEIVDVETTGYVLRICPFEDVSMVGLTEDLVDSFLQCLEEKCGILNSTVVQRSKFIDLIEKEPNLQHVDISHWAGLGGVRFIPSEYVKTEESVAKDLMETEENLINQRNMELVATLRSTDSAFSLGEGPDRAMCVRFGMVTMETDVEELLNLVINCGKDIDEAVNQLESLSEVVKRGMEQAQSELSKEAEDQLWQEGLLRHVPIVGSFYNWLLPFENNKIKGRCLNLNEGKLETTENVYKGQMQIQIEDGQEL